MGRRFLHSFEEINIQQPTLKSNAKGEKARPSQVPVALTIAGSDSGGGAGIQADLKTFMAVGVFGTSAITCITAQNPDRVTAVEAVSVDMVADQVRAVCDGFPIAAAKTGMLYSSEIIRTVAALARDCDLGLLVVDPVMIATSGSPLLRDDAVDALVRELIPLATVITPNVPEAEVLCGHGIADRDDLIRAAIELSRKFGVACVAKGGHLAGADPVEDLVVDVLCADGAVTLLESTRIDVRETHGTGCTFSAAMTGYLAQGETLEDAFRDAKQFVAGGLAHAMRAGNHYPLGIGLPDHD